MSENSPNFSAGSPNVSAGERLQVLISQAAQLLEDVSELATGPALADDPSWLQRILERTMESFTLADAGIIALYDEKSGLDYPVASHIKDPTIYMDIHLRASEGTIAWCYSNKQPRIWSASEAEDDGFSADDLLYRDQLLIEQQKPAYLNSSLVCCPLLAHGQVLGAIQLEHNTDGRQFTELEMQVLLNFVASPLAQAIDRFDLVGRIHSHYEEFSRFYRRVVVMREQSMKRVTHRLNTRVTQTLAGIHIALNNLDAAIDRDFDKESIHQYLRELDGDVRQAMDDVDELTYIYGSDIRADDGLIGALEVLLNRRTAEAGITQHFDIEDFDDELLDEQCADTLFHVAQQAIENVIEHSHAENIYVSLTGLENLATLTVSDDGRGFTKEDLDDNPRFGLLGMSERLALVDGSFLVVSQAGFGTKITASVPVCEAHEEDAQ